MEETNPTGAAGEGAYPGGYAAPESILPGDPGDPGDPCVAGGPQGGVPAAQRPSFLAEFMPHMVELRSRILKAVLALAVGFGVCYAWAKELYLLLARPLTDVLPAGSHLVMLQITEGFTTHLKVGFFAGMVLASPVVLHQAWAFVAPGLLPREKKVLLSITPWATLLFAAGVLFGYFFFLPAAMSFFVSYLHGSLVGTFSINAYLSFVTWSLLAFGIVFQVPLLIVLLNSLGLVYAPALRRFRKFALLLSFMLGAVLTPTPDAVNQCFIALPLYVFYELSILVIVLFGRRPDAEAGDGAAQASPAG